MKIVVTFSAYLHHRTIHFALTAEGSSEDELMMAFKRSVSMADLTHAYHPITSFLYLTASSSVLKYLPLLTLYILSLHPFTLV